MANRLLHEDWSEEEFEKAIRGRNNLIGVDKERKGFCQFVLSGLRKNLQLYLFTRMKELSYSAVSKHP